MRRLPALILAAAAALVLSPALTTGAQASTALPADPAAHGYIGLCDETGHNVTGGNIDTAPFIWKAVASQPPPAAYQGRGENAVLNVYQPRPQIEAAEWSGQSLTAASFYSTRAHPAVQATYADGSLADFVHAYPPLVDGLYVLRMYYGKANYGLYDRSYPTTTIQVSGSRWNVVHGGTVDCGSAKGVSNEQLTGVISRQQFTAKSAPPAGQTLLGGSGAHAAVISRSPSGQVPTGDAPASSGRPTSDAALAGPVHPAGNGAGWTWWLAIPALVLLALGVVLLALRRSRRSRT